MCILKQHKPDQDRICSHLCPHKKFKTSEGRVIELQAVRGDTGWEHCGKLRTNLDRVTGGNHMAHAMQDCGGLTEENWVKAKLEREEASAALYREQHPHEVATEPKRVSGELWFLPDPRFNY